MEILNIRTSRRIEMVEITNQVREKAKNIKKGAILVYTPHTTSAITINENADPSVKRDMMNYFNNLVPHSGDYTHMEGNSDSHIKSSMIGASELIIVENGNLQLGTWQGIFFCEFDGPRSRKVYLQTI